MLPCARPHLAHHALAHSVAHPGHLLLALLGEGCARAKSKGTNQRYSEKTRFRFHDLIFLMT